MQIQQEQARIVLVDDDKSDRVFARRALENQNYCVYEAMSGERLQEILTNFTIDLILLDLKMPGESGLNLIPFIRKKTDAPIIIVSGVKDPADKRRGLHQGADDYISKPFYPEELQARIHANLRRYKSNASRKNSIQRIGAWTINHDTADLYDKDGIAQGLTVQEFQLIHKLIDAEGRTLTRHELSDQTGGRGTDIHVTRIRKKLNSPDFIQTIRGVGYRIPPPTQHS